MIPFDNVQIEIRLTHHFPDLEKDYYQVMRVHPRECVSSFMLRKQAIDFCEKEKLNIVKILDIPFQK